MGVCATVTSFGARVRRGEQLLGALVRMPNEGLVELAGLVGLDFVVIDTEHGPGDQLALAHHLNAAGANGLSVLVRIGSPGEALRVLDLGADGILAPHVSSVAQARDLLDAVHYPPRGRRGFATYSRAGAYGLTSAVEHHANSRHTVVIAMIEDPAGLAAAAGIAALDGIDGLMLGPADYATELGVVGRLDDPRVLAAGAGVREHSRQAGVAPVSIVGGPRAAEAAFSAGDTVVMYNVQLALGQLFTDLAAGRPGDRPLPDARPGRSLPDARVASTMREPLVLLPGMLGDATVWDDVSAELADVAVPQAARIDLDESIAEMAASVLAAAPERFALAGHSLGAIVAMEIMRQAPQRVTRVALANTAANAPLDAQQTAWSALADRIDDDFPAIAAELARATLPEDRTDLLERNEKMACSVGPEGLRRQLRAQQGRTSYLDEVGRYRVPVLVISGDLDAVSPPARQQAILDRCPEAELVSISDAGHLAPMERPAEVAAALRAWLAR